VKNVNFGQVKFDQVIVCLFIATFFNGQVSSPPLVSFEAFFYFSFVSDLHCLLAEFGASKKCLE
jgi:hypothetical protein